VGRSKDAQKILLKGAKINKKTISKELMPNSQDEDSKNKEKPDFKLFFKDFNFREKIRSFNLSKMAKNSNFVDLFKTRIMVWRTLNMFFQVYLFFLSQY